eukprot:m.17121 g.17121  ORF g.17121 m.17121 type:complete len:57 (-) comp9224_c0_seq1:186-356(-)
MTFTLSRRAVDQTSEKEEKKNCTRCLATWFKDTTEARSLSVVGFVSLGAILIRLCS